MFTKAKVSVNLEVIINKQIGDDVTIGKVREEIELEVDRILKKVTASDKSVKVISMSRFLDAQFSE